MARELTREEKSKIRALVVKWCANYDKEYFRQNPAEWQEHC